MTHQTVIPCAVAWKCKANTYRGAANRDVMGILTLATGY